MPFQPPEPIGMPSGSRSAARAMLQTSPGARRNRRCSYPGGAHGRRSAGAGNPGSPAVPGMAGRTQLAPVRRLARGDAAVETAVGNWDHD